MTNEVLTARVFVSALDEATKEQLQQNIVMKGERPSTNTREGLALLAFTTPDGPDDGLLSQKEVEHLFERLAKVWTPEETTRFINGMEAARSELT